ncbi:hypothetical protein PAXRUDRAFT_833432 [Paxillus rubicundulus Ve08.2h10]|uniref:Uncharacterized protein n=1 Tax=Paxillus rubicundulus Ve08.2h10 TaxID=930991 RepID=A0A0D0CYA6_9AGAM|nr:hypothetical protein PAXRUDRAFT_833432 [Paxillus rubicundulus Ve08.2h10]
MGQFVFDSVCATTRTCLNCRQSQAEATWLGLSRGDWGCQFVPLPRKSEKWFCMTLTAHEPKHRWQKTRGLMNVEDGPYLPGAELILFRGVTLCRWNT